MTYSSPTLNEVYEMIHPEQVGIKLELSRSFQWWGIFTDITQEFNAIRKDRTKIVSWYSDIELNAYSNCNINIEVLELQHTNYVTIYEGNADIKSRIDDTKTLQLNFSQSDKVVQFLENGITLTAPSVPSTVATPGYEYLFSNTSTDLSITQFNRRNGFDNDRGLANGTIRQKPSVSKFEISTISDSLTNAVFSNPPEVYFSDNILIKPSGLSFDLALRSPVLNISNSDTTDGAAIAELYLENEGNRQDFNLVPVGTVASYANSNDVKIIPASK